VIGALLIALVMYNVGFFAGGEWTQEEPPQFEFFAFGSTFVTNSEPPVRGSSGRRFDHRATAVGLPDARGLTAQACFCGMRRTWPG
jgi:hypothetical protein